MLLYSRDRGYVVANNTLYALGRNNEWNVIPVPGKTFADRLVESDDSSIQPVVFPFGWGVFHTGSGQWLAQSERGGSSFYSRGSVLTVVNDTPELSAVRTYDFSGLKPRLLRSINGDNVVNRSTTCANEYGIINYENGDFVWHRMK